MKKSKDKGVALLMALSILMGMLMLVLPMAYLQIDAYKETKIFDSKTKLSYMKANAKYLFAEMGEDGEDIPAGLKRIMKAEYNLVPLKLFSGVLPGGLSKFATSIPVDNMLPLFVFRAKKTPYKLSSNLTATQDFSVNSELKNNYICIGEEIMITDSSGQVSAGNRGVMGRKTSHKIGAEIYGILSDEKKVYIKVDDELMMVTDWDVNTGYLQVIRAVNGNQESHGDTGNGFYMDVYVSYESDDTMMYVDVEYENSKANVNSLSPTLIESIGNALVIDPANNFLAKMQNAYAGGLNYTLYNTNGASSLPFYQGSSILQANHNNLAMGPTGFGNKLELFSDQMQSLDAMLTGLSMPFFYNANRDIVLPTFQRVRLRGEVIIPVDRIGIVAKPATESLEIQANFNDQDSLILWPHSVNVNMADFMTLRALFSELATPVDQTEQITGAEARNYAQAIINYRNGEKANESADSFDGDENPFDGYDRANNVQYPDAASEFMAFLLDSADYSPSGTSLQYPWLARQLLPGRYNSHKNEITAPICFEPGYVLTRRYRYAYVDSTKQNSIPLTVSGASKMIDVARMTKPMTLSHQTGWGGNFPLYTFFTTNEPARSEGATVHRFDPLYAVPRGGMKLDFVDGDRGFDFTVPDSAYIGWNADDTLVLNNVPAFTNAIQGGAVDLGFRPTFNSAILTANPQFTTKFSLDNVLGFVPKSYVKVNDEVTYCTDVDYQNKIITVERSVINRTTHPQPSYSLPVEMVNYPTATANVAAVDNAIITVDDINRFPDQGYAWAGKNFFSFMKNGANLKVLQQDSSLDPTAMTIQASDEIHVVSDQLRYGGSNYSGADYSFIAPGALNFTGAADLNKTYKVSGTVTDNMAGALIMSVNVLVRIGNTTPADSEIDFSEIVFDPTAGMINFATFKLLLHAPGFMTKVDDERVSLTNGDASVYSALGGYIRIVDLPTNSMAIGQYDYYDSATGDIFGINTGLFQTSSMSALAGPFWVTPFPYPYRPFEDRALSAGSETTYPYFEFMVPVPPDSQCSIATIQASTTGYDGSVVWKVANTALNDAYQLVSDYVDISNQVMSGGALPVNTSGTPLRLRCEFVPPYAQNYFTGDIYAIPQVFSLQITPQNTGSTTEIILEKE